MKKLLSLILVLVLASASALAEIDLSDYAIANGVVSAAEYVDITAPYSGTMLPFSLEIRQTLVILAFAPIGASVPGFTGEMGGDVGLSSAFNSICMCISIVVIVSLLLIML